MGYTTRFRAYQLDSPGSLFSYYKKHLFTLIEARLPKGGVEVIEAELKLFGKTKIDILHITSWDYDHSDFISLSQIINKFRPARIEAPAYEPTTDSGKLCKRILDGFDRIHQDYIVNTIYCDHNFYDKLPSATPFGTADIAYRSKFDVSNKNDMSLIRLFRSEGFSVLSLGDCESTEITDNLNIEGSVLCTETDVLILAHHGSDNSCISGKFLDGIKPKHAICSANRGNKYGHPETNVKSLLTNRNIPFITTKDGDVIIQQLEGESVAKVINLISNNTVIKDVSNFTPKRFTK